MKGTRGKWLGLCLAVLALIAVGAAACAGDAPADMLALLDDYGAKSYTEYAQTHADKAAGGMVTIGCAEGFAGEGLEIISNYNGMAGDGLLVDGEGYVTYALSVPKSGLYAIDIHYCTTENGSSDVAYGLLLNGELPFSQAREVILPRLWKDEGSVRTDPRGNDIRQRQVPQNVWQNRYLHDSRGYYDDPFLFYLPEGENEITLISLRDEAVLREITLSAYAEAQPYAQVLAEYEARGYERTRQTITIEAEQATQKSSATLYAFNDRASPSVSPYRGSKIVMNAIGGVNWKSAGQEITWDIHVPETGLYEIALKGKQNISACRPSHRRLTIDGELPFEEAVRFTFAYGLNWENHILSDGEGTPYLFYLTEGVHSITLSVSLGESAQVVRRLEDSVLALNDAYRKIIMVTGTSPDIYRDYDIDIILPDVITAFTAQAQELSAINALLLEITGVKGEEAASIERTVVQLESFLQKPRTIAKRLDVFKSNLSGLASMILLLSEQYLTLDTITLGDTGALAPAEAGFLAKTEHGVSMFGASFSEDYNTIGAFTDLDEALTLWVSTGRDQAEVLRRLIDEQFTSETGIPVNLKLVPSGVLLSATLADMNPDVVIQLGMADPVNYAMRGALVDLTQFADFEEVAARFSPEVMIPYEYGGKVYALPETMQFSLMFYRKDIFDELGLTPPTTWDEFFVVLGELQKNNLEVGFPYTSIANYGYGTLNGGMQTYMMFLSQLGGELYKDGNTKSNIDSAEGIEAFRIWTNLYANHQLPLTYDFANRFRLGEMPLAIADYTSFNMLQVLAPEIQGLWSFTVVPGMVDEEGNIDRSVPYTGNACVIMENSNDHIDESWAFLKWWTSAEAQVAYGREMESLLGASARYPTANLEALAQLPWSRSEYNVIYEQMLQIKGVPEVPGGYFTPRHIDNAFRAVVLSGEDARDTVLDYVRYINDELAAKQDEFGLK